MALFDSIDVGYLEYLSFVVIWAIVMIVMRNNYKDRLLSSLELLLEQLRGIQVF